MTKRVEMGSRRAAGERFAMNSGKGRSPNA